MAKLEIMLYLNNPLLTSDQIISHFKSDDIQYSKAMPENSKTPSKLTQLKNKLKTNQECFGFMF